MQCISDRWQVIHCICFAGDRWHYMAAVYCTRGGSVAAFVTVQSLSKQMMLKACSTQDIPAGSCAADAYRLTLELRDRQARVNVLATKFETITSKNRATDPEGGEPKSQAYYIIKVSMLAHGIWLAELSKCYLLRQLCWMLHDCCMCAVYEQSTTIGQCHVSASCIQVPCQQLSTHSSHG